MFSHFTGKEYFLFDLLSQKLYSVYLASDFYVSDAPMKICGSCRKFAYEVNMYNDALELTI